MKANVMPNQTDLTKPSLTMIALAFLAMSCATNPKSSKPIQIERSESVGEIPVAMRGGKLFIMATIGDQNSEFIFDTGTPTMIAKSFADKLGLQVTGQNSGRDAHGKVVKMAKTIVPTMQIGGLTLRNVPALVFDFGKLELGPCFFQGGVIGSEILKGSAWRLSRERLLVADSAEKLPKLSQKAIKAQLVTGSYPFPPLVKVRFGDLEDLTLFDTGNRDELVLYEPVAKRVSSKNERIGTGSAGVSAGGQAPDRPLRRMTVSDVSLGNKPLGSLSATTRISPPSLLGAGLLARYDVVLDYVANTFALDPLTAPKLFTQHPGYAITIVKGLGKVTQLYRGSAAEKAGLKLGDKVLEVNDRKLAFTATTTNYTSPKCAAARWLAQKFDSSQPAKITVERKGRRVDLSLP